MHAVGVPAPLPFVWRVTKYDPADRDEHGYYVGAETIWSDHGPVEQAYLDAVAAFCEDAGVSGLVIRDPEVAWLISFGVEAPIPGHGLAGLFPPDLAGYHDGAEVPLATAVQLVRAMLRDHGAWCRLEAGERFFVHVGQDQYLFLGSAQPCPRAVARTRQLGLFVEPVEVSPLDPALNEPAERRPADAAFWAELAGLLRLHGPLLLEEGYVANAARWHRLTSPAQVEAVRARLTPRARLWVWPDLSADVGQVLAGLPDGLFEVVWADATGRINSQTATDAHHAEVRKLLAGASAATIIPGDGDLRHPLLTGVLPDADGVLRARWAP
jgi:hypothetical protein